MRFLALGNIALLGALLSLSCNGNSDGQAIPILPLASDSTANNVQTPVETNPPEPQVTLPGDFGTNGPEAFLMTDPASVNRYANLEFEFSERMDLATVEGNLTVLDSGSNPLPGPGAGGTFRWVSPRKVIFDPYKELKDDESYQIQFGAGAHTEDGDSLIASSQNFSIDTEPSFAMTHEINGYTVGSNRGVSLSQGSNPTLTLTSTLAHYDKVEKRTLSTLDGTSVELCSSGCSTGTFVTDLAAAGMSPTNGGNPLFYKIELPNGRKYYKQLTFNYGKFSANPNGIQSDIGAAVLDNSQMMEVISRIFERFAKADYKVANKTFNNFANEHTSTVRRPGCIDSTDIDSGTNPSSFHNFQYIRSYGNGTGAYSEGYGYCGFFINNFSTGLGSADFTIDVYVTSMTVNPTVGSNVPNVDANMAAYDNGSPGLGADINGHQVHLNLTLISKLSDVCGFCLLGVVLGNNDKIAFTAEAVMDYDGNPSVRKISRARVLPTTDTSGHMNFAIKTPFDTDDPYFNLSDPDEVAGDPRRFHMSPWTNDIVVQNLDAKASTAGIFSWGFIGDLIASIATGIANNITPIIQPKIVQSVLQDVVEQIAPNVINAVLDNLQDPGLSIPLPSHLPAPLNQTTLLLKLKVQQGLQPKVTGPNAGLVGTAATGITASISPPNPNAPQTMLGTHSFNVYRSAAPSWSYPFSQSAAQPGLLLALHGDALNQAMFQLWQAGALSLSIDKNFIDTINAYAGNDPLRTLTDDLLKVGTLVTVLAPGKDTITGLDGGGNPFVIDSDDDVIIQVNPVLAPAVRFAALSGGPGTEKPDLIMDLGDLELVIKGKKSNGTTYTITRIRTSLTASGSADLLAFSNPTGNPAYANTTALQVQIDPNNMYYIVEVLEGSSNNPYGLDPEKIYRVVDPLVKSLVVPLLNNILYEVPLAKQIPLSQNVSDGLRTSGGACWLNLDRNVVSIDTLPIPSNSTEPYIFARLHAMVADKGSVIGCP